MTRWLSLSEVLCVDTAREKEFLDWWGNIHAADILETPGFLTARLCETKDIDGRGKFLSLFEIETDDIDKTIVLRREKHVKELEAGRGSTTFIPIWRDVFWEQIAKLVADKEHNPKMEKWVRLSETWCVPASRDDEFNNWYTDVHLPNVLEIPGYMTATRHKQKELRYGRGTYFSVYEVETDDIDKTVAVAGEYLKKEIERGEDPSLWVWAWPNCSCKLIAEHTTV